jgi:hypothetical protein
MELVLRRNSDVVRGLATGAERAGPVADRAVPRVLAVIGQLGAHAVRRFVVGDIGRRALRVVALDAVW